MEQHLFREAYYACEATTDRKATKSLLAFPSTTYDNSKEEEVVRVYVLLDHMFACSWEAPPLHFFFADLDYNMKKHKLIKFLNRYSILYRYHT